MEHPIMFQGTEF